MNWARELVSVTFIKTSISKANQILASEINVNGKYPVIDQGQSYIAGYSDTEEKVVNDGLPYVIFGDHTRIIKYVDFPFIIGADGTKVLKPKSEYNTKFYYYALLSLNIPNRGYNRHFTILKEKFIPKPPLPEQQKIAAVLSTVQRAIELQNELIERTTELKKSMMHKLFTEGVKGESQKETEIGMVPESWEVVEFSEMVIYTSKPRNLSVEYPVLFIPMELLSDRVIYITKTEIRDRVSSGTFVFNGDLLLAKITPSFENGKQGIVKVDAEYSYATTEVIAFKEKDRVSDKLFLFYWLKKNDVRNDLAGKMEGSTGRQRLNKPVLDKKLIPKPSCEEQIEIARILYSIDNKIEQHCVKKSKLEELFRTLLHQLMTAHMRVDGFDVSLLKEAN